MIECEIVELQPQTAAVVRGEVRLEELPSFFGASFTAVWAALETQGVAAIGAPFGYYAEMPSDVVKVEAGFPTSRAIEPAGDVVPMVLPGGRAVSAIHVGPFDTLEQTYTELMAWMAEQRLQPAEHMWEIYLSDPATEPDPSTWRTQIVWPVDAPQTDRG